MLKAIKLKKEYRFGVFIIIIECPHCYEENTHFNESGVRKCKSCFKEYYLT